MTGKNKKRLPQIVRDFIVGVIAGTVSGVILKLVEQLLE